MELKVISPPLTVQQRCIRCAILIFAFWGNCSLCLAAPNLDVVESFWTDRVAPLKPGEISQKVEVDRQDRQAIFAVTLVNRNRLDITAIRATIGVPNGVKLQSNSGNAPRVFHTGTVRMGDSFTLLFPLEFSEAFDNRSYQCPVTIEYMSAGKHQNYSETVTAQLRTTGRTKLEVIANGSLQPGKAVPVSFQITNRGTAPIASLQVSLHSEPDINAGTSQVAIVPSSQADFEVAALEPGQSIDRKVSIYTSPVPAGSVHTVVARLKYVNACHQEVVSSSPLSLGAFSRPHRMLVELQSSSKYPTAQPGMVTDFPVVVANHSDQQLTNLSIEVTAAVESLRVLGQQHWTIASLPAGSQQLIAPTVYVAKDLSERAASLRLLIQAELEGMPYQQTAELGFFVNGSVRLIVQDAVVVRIGGTPNLTGNLLNEGVGTARFARMEILPDEEWKGPVPEPLYLGDIIENSPQPFSIPLSPDSPLGDGLVNFRFSFKNALREPMSTTVAATVRGLREDGVSSKDATDESIHPRSDAIAWFLGGLAGGLGLTMLWRLRQTSRLTQLLREQKLQGQKSLDEALKIPSAQEPV